MSALFKLSIPKRTEVEINFAYVNTGYFFLKLYVHIFWHPLYNINCDC